MCSLRTESKSLKGISVECRWCQCRRHFFVLMKDEQRKKLETAFLNTNYFVEQDEGGSILIRVGEPNANLDELLRGHGVNAWAFVTAYNPFGQQTSDADNDRRHAELCGELAKLGIKFLLGCGESVEKDWPPERSVLALGLDKEASIELGRKFEQLAIVVGVLGGRSKLEWCGQN